MHITIKYENGSDELSSAEALKTRLEQLHEDGVEFVDVGGVSGTNSITGLYKPEHFGQLVSLVKTLEALETDTIRDYEEAVKKADFTKPEETPDFDPIRTTPSDECNPIWFYWVLVLGLSVLLAVFFIATEPSSDAVKQLLK